ncbi:hypothetical protein Hanom_Chr05g00452341 [Helianthus anomalus]
MKKKVKCNRKYNSINDDKCSETTELLEFNTKHFVHNIIRHNSGPKISVIKAESYTDRTDAYL